MRAAFSKKRTSPKLKLIIRKQPYSLPFQTQGQDLFLSQLSITLKFVEYDHFYKTEVTVLSFLTIISIKSYEVLLIDDLKIKISFQNQPDFLFTSFLYH